MIEKIKSQLRQSMDVKREILEDNAMLGQIARVAEIWVAALRSGKKLLFAGNGGSAADSQHLSAEFVGRFKLERDALPALALNTDTSFLTAVGNDYGFEHIFSRQVQALGNQGDVFVGISTSGNSANVVKAIEQAKKNGLSVIGFTGSGGGKMDSLCDVNLCVPSDDTPRIQEAHITLGHILCDLTEKQLFPSG